MPQIRGTEVNIKMVPIGAIGLVVFALYLAASLAFVRNVPVRYLAWQMYSSKAGAIIM
jgi:hypothetical protein